MIIGVFKHALMITSFVLIIAVLVGNQSGIKGWAIAVVGGILSHGSSYIWYQMLAN